MEEQQEQITSIVCGECGGGVRMRYKGTTTTKPQHHIYRCPFGHVFSQPVEQVRRKVIHWNGNPPNSAA